MAVFIDIQGYRLVLPRFNGVFYRGGSGSLPRHGRLTNSPARTDVVLLIRRAVRLAERAHEDGGVGYGRLAAPVPMGE